MKALLIILSIIFGIAYANSPLLPTNKATLALRASTIKLIRGSTGFVVEGSKTHKHYLVTNFHVCDLNGLTDIVKSDAIVDLCAIEAPDSVPALKLAKEVIFGQVFYTRGYPNGNLVESAGEMVHDVTWDHEYDKSTGGCPNGMVERVTDDGAMAYCLVVYHTMLTTLYARPGSSGSPVVDSAASLVGVMANYDKKDAYAGGIVKFEDLKKFLEDL